MMKRSMLRGFSLGRILLASGLTFIALAGLLRGELVPKWAPAPHDLPFGAAFARVTDLALLVFGLSILAPARFAVKAALGLSLLMMLWIAVLHVPQLIAHPKMMVRWGYLAGVVTVGSGAVALWAAISMTSGEPRPHERWILWSLRIAGILMGCAIAFFGVSHLLFAHDVSVLVPAPLPFKSLIAVITGLAHIGAGLALISGVLNRQAAFFEALMMSAFVAFVDWPRVIGGLVHGPPWALGFETAMAGAVWCMAAALTLAPRRARLAASGGASPEAVETKFA